MSLQAVVRITLLLVAKRSNEKKEEKPTSLFLNDFYTDEIAVSLDRINCFLLSRYLLSR